MITQALLTIENTDLNKFNKNICFKNCYVTILKNKDNIVLKITGIKDKISSICDILVKFCDAKICYFNDEYML